MQVKLLRAIQEKAVRPVGAREELATDVRILSATHRDLRREVEEGRFRNDLFYRINVISLQVPSLRERPSDIPLLASYLLQRIAATVGTDIRYELDNSALQALADYPFPGNVRELENILERACALSNSTQLTATDLHLPQAQTSAAHDTSAHVDTKLSPEAALGQTDDYLENVEREILTKALETSRWNKTAAAKLLGISFRSLRYRLKKLNLDD